VPSLRRAIVVLGRVLRLRCPHCGRGAVLGRWAAVRPRCAACGFRYERSDENYFQGAMFFHFLLGGGAFVAFLLAVVLAAWPDVPWDALTWGTPAAMIASMVVLRPFSKVVWLGFDVLMRPATPDELEPPPASD
jgi:uncharacterized protein (DUF983 family)